MAYDKIIDSAALNTNLTSIANAIRSKGGTSAALAFPAGFVNAISAVEVGGKVTMEEYDITIASDLGQPTGANSMPNILTGNAFVKAHYADDGFAAMLVPKTPISAGTNIMHGAFHGNFNIGASGIVRYGFIYQSTSTSALGYVNVNTKISGTGYNISLRAQSTGNLILYCANNRTVKAGTYRLILMVYEV